jgi:hypothetical protein
MSIWDKIAQFFATWVTAQELASIGEAGNDQGGRDVQKNAFCFSWCGCFVGGRSCLEGGCGNAARSEQPAISRAQFFTR